jgi:hypothetical protein
LTEGYDWFVVRIEPRPIIHKVGRKVRSPLQHYQILCTNFAIREMSLQNTRKSIAELQRCAKHSLNNTAVQQTCRPGHKPNLTCALYYTADNIYVWWSTLTMEVTSYSKMSLHIYQTTRCHIKVYVIFSQS